MEEQLISFQTAKLAKENGFISRPTQSLLQKWLREVHKLNVDVLTVIDYFNCLLPNNLVYSFIIFQHDELDRELNIYSTYEEALERGLLVALKFLAEKNGIVVNSN